MSLYAQKIGGHDLSSKLGLLDLGFYISPTSPHIISNLLFFKSTLGAICFLESEDSSLLNSIPQKSLANGLLGELNHYENSPENSLKINSEININQADYFSIYQIVKNSVKRRYKTSLDIFSLDDFKVLSIADRGYGILDKARNPLPSEQINEVFGSFSTTGGGFGLQIVKKLTDLRGGFIEVQTKREGETMPVIYNSLKGIVQEPFCKDNSIESFSTGTCFSIYLNKNR